MSLGCKLHLTSTPAQNFKYSAVERTHLLWQTEGPGSWAEGGFPLYPSNRLSPVQVTHWHSPYFFAYFPTASSYPAMLADMLCGAIGCIGFSWVSDGVTQGPCYGDMHLASEGDIRWQCPVGAEKDSFPGEGAS